MACSTVLAAGAVTGAAVLLPGATRPAAGITDAALGGSSRPAGPAGPGPSALSPAMTSLKAAHTRGEVAAALLVARQAAARQAAQRAAAAAAAAAAQQQAAQQQASQQQAAPPPAAAPPVSAGSAQQIALSMLGSFGWSSSQFSCLNSLWSRESGWSVTAENPSGAYGIPQALPGSKMASAGPDWQTDAATQIRWGLGYIQGSYGSPCGAWSHEEATGWY